MFSEEYMTPAIDLSDLKQDRKKQKNIVLPPMPDTKDIRERSKAVEDDIFKVYYELMMDEDVAPSVRKSCADALADRARGKPAGEAPHVAVQINNSFVPDDEVVRQLNFIMAAAKQKESAIEQSN